jgi:hypothetical protein
MIAEFDATYHDQSAGIGNLAGQQWARLRYRNFGGS